MSTSTPAGSKACMRVKLVIRLHGTPVPGPQQSAWLVLGSRHDDHLLHFGQLSLDRGHFPYEAEARLQQLPDVSKPLYLTAALFFSRAVGVDVVKALTLQPQEWNEVQKRGKPVMLDDSDDESLDAHIPSHDRHTEECCGKQLIVDDKGASEHTTSSPCNAPCPAVLDAVSFGLSGSAKSDAMTQQTGRAVPAQEAAGLHDLAEPRPAEKAAAKSELTRLPCSCVAKIAAQATASPQAQQVCSMSKSRLSQVCLSMVMLVWTFANLNFWLNIYYAAGAARKRQRPATRLGLPSQCTC
jgi:hypothetical protein